MQTRARRSSSPRTSTRTRSFDLKASDTMRHASGVMVPAGFVTRITTEPIRCRASRSSGSSCRFVLKSTRHTSGERPRATRSSVQKSPTVTTGLARPIAGRMASPCTSEPMGQRRYSRNESGRRNVASANSANAKGELPIDMDAHLLRDLGPRVVHDDYVALPILRCLVPAQRALVLVRPSGEDRRDVQEAVQGAESHESAELKDFHHGALDDLLEGRREHEGVVLHPLVHRAVAVDDATFAHPLDVARDQRERLVRPDLAFEGCPGKLSGHGIDVLPQAFGRDADDVLPLDPLVHENRRGSYWFHLFITLRRGSGGSRFFWGTLRSTREQESDSSELCERPSSTFLWAFGLT